jgi:hypothetical protein
MYLRRQNVDVEGLDVMAKRFLTEFGHQIIVFQGISE